MTVVGHVRAASARLAVLQFARRAVGVADEVEPDGAVLERPTFGLVLVNSRAGVVVIDQGGIFVIILGVVDNVVDRRLVRRLDRFEKAGRRRPLEWSRLRWMVGHGRLETLRRIRRNHSDVRRGGLDGEGRAVRTSATVSYRPDPLGGSRRGQEDGQDGQGCHEPHCIHFYAKKSRKSRPK